MFSQRFPWYLAGTITASVALAIIVMSPARADDSRFTPRTNAPESAACKSARQYALFERQWLLNEGDTDPFQPMPEPSECRGTKTGDGAVKAPSAKDARPEAQAQPKAALDTYSAPYLGGA